MSSTISIWSPSVYYYPNDFVQYAGLTWSCDVTNINQEPPTSPLYWTVFTPGGGGGGGGQTLSLAGNNITLSGGGGSVDVSTATAVSATTQKTTDQSYTVGVTSFANGVQCLDLEATNDVNAGQRVQVGLIGGPSLIELENGDITATGTLDVATITDSTNATGSAGQLLSAGAGGGSLAWVTPTTPSPQTLSLAGNTISLSSGGGSVDIATATTVAFRSSVDLYVSPNGSDTTGNGSFLNPYQTIQKAVTQAELTSSAALIFAINVTAGHYNESITFNKGYVLVSGVSQSRDTNELTEITGNITVACVGANDIFNRQVVLQNLQITGTITDTSTASHTLNLQNIKVYSSSNLVIHQNASSPDSRTYITDCVVTSTNATQNTTPMIVISNGQAYISRCEFTTGGTGGLLATNGTGIIARCSLSTFESSYAALLSPSTSQFCLVRLGGSSPSVNQFGNCGFSYTGNIARPATETNATAIALDSTANKILNLLQCVFVLFGTANPNQHVVINYSNPTAGNNTVAHGLNIAAPPYAHRISGTRITTIPYTAVV